MSVIVRQERPFWRRIFAFARDKVKEGKRANSSEVALMGRLAEGDPDAAEKFVADHADALYRFVYHQVGGVVQDAEDIVQETFLAAVRQAGRFRGQSRLRTWLFSIASHKVVDHWRRQRRYAELPLLTEQQVADGGVTQEMSIEQMEMCQVVRQGLLHLPPHYRTALILRYVEGFSVAETARVMQRSVKSVESILVRARRKLAEVLRGVA